MEGDPSMGVFGGDITTVDPGLVESGLGTA